VAKRKKFCHKKHKIYNLGTNVFIFDNANKPMGKMHGNLDHEKN